MKKVMLVALVGMFSLAMFARTQENAKPAEKKTESPKTEAVKPATVAETTSKDAKPTAKEESKTARTAKQKTTDVARPAGKNNDVPKK